MAIQTDPSKANAKYTFLQWQEGIADSPELGFGVIRNVEIGMFPGQAIPANKPVTWTKTLTNKSYTVDTGTNIFTVAAADIPADGIAITFTNSGGTLPAGLASKGDYAGGTSYVYGDTVNYNGAIYTAVRATTGNNPSNNYYWSVAYFYVTYLSPTTFSVKRTIAGSAIDITSAGTGTNKFSTATVGVPKNGLTWKYISSGTFRTATIIQDDKGSIWLRDFNNTSYFQLLQGNSLFNSAQANGMTLFKGSNDKDWLVVCTDYYISFLDLTTFNSTSAMNWTNGDGSNGFTFTTAAAGVNHSCMLGQDNIMYFCDGRYILSVKEVNGQNFDPTNSATYTVTPKALSLPGTALAQCLEELGTNLLIGDQTSNYIYPWDRTSTNFSLPMRCPENNIYKMLNVDNTVYILAGSKGVIYSTTGYQVAFFKKFPEYVTGGQVQWGGLEKINGHLIVGVLGLKADSGPGNYKNGGVYKVFLHTITPGVFVIDNAPVGNSESVLPSCLVTYTTDSYFIGSSGQIDYVTPYQVDPATGDPSGRYKNYESFIESPVISVSPLQEFRDFTLSGVEMAKKLVAGEGFQMQYRLNITDAYSALKTFDYASYPSMINDYSTSTISKAQSIQIKMMLASSSSSDQSPRLKTVTIQ